MDDGKAQIDINAALQSCADEPVHIPGSVQSFGALIAVSPSDRRITYVSENASDMLGLTTEELLGSSLSDVFDRDVLHALNNAFSIPGIVDYRFRVGALSVGSKVLDFSVFEINRTFVIEMEEAEARDGISEANLRSLSDLTRKIQGFASSQAMFDEAVHLLRRLTGYDRVMLYKFDPNYNGVVIAESKVTQLEPFLGLHFPHWDIPEQARAIMYKVPLRIIHDIDANGCTIIPSSRLAAPLDITFAHVRGTSPIHMQYLRNMGIHSTMTLSLIYEGKLWGIISFHNRTPILPSPTVREMLTDFCQVFTAGLTILLQRETLDLIRRIDETKNQILEQVTEEDNTSEPFDKMAEMLLDIFNAQGAALWSDNQVYSFGKVPSALALNEVFQLRDPASVNVEAIDSLAEKFPELVSEFGEAGGAIIISTKPDRAIAIFRPHASVQTKWAGNPEKEITVVDGQSRLQPRGSFSLYLQERAHRCQPWSDQDIYFAERIWAIVNSVGRQALVNTLRRQQDLMIAELNHRVRNILALVRSVSTQTRTRYNNISDYASTIESRIAALANAHQIGSASLTEKVSLREMIDLEVKPYTSAAAPQVKINGDDAFLRPDVTPIVALVLHELSTNAVKYGALSNKEGMIDIDLAITDDGLRIDWIETGGPKVTPPDERGFGSRLIEQAVPYEIGGEATLDFAPEGLRASLALPSSALVRSQMEKGPLPNAALDAEVHGDEAGPGGLSGKALIVEDNFLIATAMADQLTRYGVKDVEMFAGVHAATEWLKDNRPKFAVLDVNLGNGATTEPVAKRLQSLGIPFIFVTGYGEALEIAPDLSEAPILTKPVEDADLKACLISLVSKH